MEFYIGLNKVYFFFIIDGGDLGVLEGDAFAVVVAEVIVCRTSVTVHST